MKVFIAAIIIFIFLVGFGTFAYYYVDNTANHLVTKASAVEKSAEARDWAQAEKQFGAFHTSWNRTSSKWTVMLDHQELDNINITISRAEEFLKTRHLPELMSEMAELKMLLKHIPEKEALNLKNVL